MRMMQILKSKYVIQIHKAASAFKTWQDYPD